ncbi:MAG: VanZ family protein [Corynebacterium sp.]|uniref:VanZ family protein n=1 Tax=Corynebacterium TaxID=1716 RepID=UPI00264860D2|nr:VanZ family protein [Corynebacterium sp.]MDN6304493.1 VanZ family protein [Corynebacterium sp.]MDN6366308.1 VanZ family protein [Corynebacterium sp.]MDN6395086.1 VanZ family protein [Corynebacterium sp.]
MRAQVFGSILVGLAVSAVLFLPLLVWQYRRYGRADGLRMLWTVTGFVYTAAIIAFTVFPLPQFTPGYCQAHATSPLLDPLRFPRELIDLVSAQGFGALLSDWLVWEVALNVLLFVPFGLIVRRVFELPHGLVLTAALGTSLLIELTQLTGNWGLALCPYRFADVTDLFTNTGGAIIGIAVERATPRLLSTKSYLLARRDRARPATRARRVLGMVLDVWYLINAAIIGGAAGSTIYAFMRGGTGSELTPAQMLELEHAIFLGAWIAAIAMIVIPALVRTGASFGQRTVFLQPETAAGSRTRLFLRALSVQGLAVTLTYLGFPWLLLAPLWGISALLSALISPRGLSGVLSGCTIIDSRHQPTVGPSDPEVDVEHDADRISTDASRDEG